MLLLRQQIERRFALRKWVAYILALTVAPLLGYTLADSTAWYSESIDLVLLATLILSVYLGGIAPALIAIVVSILTLSFIDFTAAPSLNWLFKLDRWIVFLFVGGCVTVLIESLHRTRMRAEAREVQALAMLTALPDAALLIDTGGNIELINITACQMNGCDVSVIGQPFSNIFHIVNAKQERVDTQLFELAGIAPPTLRDRYTLTRHDGRQIPLEINARFVHGKDAAPHNNLGLPGSSIILTLRDSSQQRRTEGMLPGALHVFRITAEGEVSMPYASPAFQEVFGVDPAQCVTDATAIIERIAPDDVAWITEHVRDHAQRKLPVHIEFEVSHPLKGIVWLSWHAIPARDNDGGTLWNGLFIDVTQRKLAEQSLRQSEARLLGIVDSAMDAIVTVDEHQGILLFNPAAEYMFRCTESGMIGMNLEVFVNNYLRADSLLLLNMLERDEISNLRLGELSNIFGRRTGGEEFPLEVAVSRSYLDGHRLLTMTLRDITERKRTAERLQLSQQQLRSALDAGDMGVMRIYIQSQQVEFDERGLALCGLKSTSQLWHPIAALMLAIHPADRHRISREYLTAIAEHTSFRTECRIRHKDHSISWIVFRGRVDQQENAPHATLTAIVVDNTYRKQLEEQRLQSQKLESLGVLAGGIAHDFNNLLLAISGNLKLALADLGESHPTAPSLHEIAKASMRAADLVRRILAFSRPQDHKREPVELNAVLEEVLGLARAVLPAAIAIRSSMPESSPRVLADASQIHQAVINLLTNASDAVSSVGGEVEVRLEVVQADAQLRQWEPELRPGSYARITIADNGRGMDQLTMRRIFDPFFTTKPVGQGTGLGLAIVHGIMKSHDGVVNVHSNVGAGTQFELYFPLYTATIANIESVSVVTNAVTHGHILYVDDEEALVFLVTRTLQRAGHQVTGFTDPSQALEAFGQQPGAFDMIVSDMSMPGMSGLELAKKILAIRPQVPFIITTGFVRAEDYEAANAVGVRQLILKPNTVEELSIALQKVLLEKAPA